MPSVYAGSPFDLLGYVPLMESVETTIGGLPKVIPEAFFTTKESVLGDKGRNIEYKGTRKVARVQPYGSPPRTVRKMDLGVRDFKLLHSIEKISYGPEMFMWLQQWDKYEPQQNAFMQQLDYQGEQFALRQENLRIAAITATIAAGVLYFDVDGNLLPNAAGADLMLDQGVPAANRGDLAGIINASWANPTTNIVTQLANLKQRGRQTTGQVLKYAFYGKNVMGYMVNNASMQAYLARNPQINKVLMDTNELPENLLGLTWIPVQDSFFEDAAGTNQDLFPADQVSFTPEVNKSWYTLYEGSYPVPKSFGLFGDAKAAMASVEYKTGMFRFAWLDNPPTTINETQGDTFLPRLKNPEAIYIADTTP